MSEIDELLTITCKLDSRLTLTSMAGIPLIMLI